VAGSLLAVVASAQPLATARLLSAGREPVTIVCMGDSITGVYYHSGGRRAYPEMLEIALHKIYPSARVRVHNAGRSGDTTRGALARLDRDVIAHKPNLVTVMFGMNDLVRIPLDEFKKNLREIAARCRSAGAEVMLCTQNSVFETKARPGEKLAEFTEAIREVGRDEGVPVVDCYAAYEAVRTRDALAWTLLHSDEIHPNMDGHKVFATAIARSISGQEISLGAVGPPDLALRHTRALLKAGETVKVLAMPPFDRLIAPALTQLFPGAKVAVTAWPTEGQTLGEIRESAKKVRAMKMNLVILAVPPSADAATPEAFHQHYAWTMNLSLNFGLQEWDVVVAPPSTVKPRLTPAERRHEEFARRLIAAQDLNMIAREPGDPSATPDLLLRWLQAH
jgi:lysophospholipase L1-like esterase